MASDPQNDIKTFLASNQDDAMLRELMRSIAMPGAIEMLYTREPDFFHGLSIQGKFNQIGACSAGGCIVAAGCRSIRPVYINGEAVDFGYLSGLRALEGHRGGRTLDIFRILREVHKDRRTKAYLNTIIDRNAQAEAALASGRKGMPIYTDLGSYICHAVNINSHHRKKPIKGLEIIKGGRSRTGEITGFLNSEGRKQQFFPVYTPEDFSSDYTRGFSADDFYLALSCGEIIGVAGKWDQSGFKQHIITGYNGVLRLARPVLNMLLKLSGYEPLPDPGEKVKMFYASFVCIKDNDPDILKALLDSIYEDNKNVGYHYFLAGFHESNRLNGAFDQFFCIKYQSRIYLATWDEDREFIDSVDNSMIPYLEAAML